MVDAAWNILGRIAPILVALLVTPRLIFVLGLTRWGIFTIALSLVGTFGIFDLGLGRALTRAVADRPQGKTDRNTADLILTGVVVLTAIGVVGGLACAACVNLWVTKGLSIDEGLRREVLFALWVFCATGPLVMINAALWGVLTGYHAFKATNLINIPISITYYVGPLLVLQVWDNLIGVMIVLAGCRMWMTVAYIRFALRLVPELRGARFRLSLMSPLMRIGGWMTVSNIAYPVLNYLDRFMIASVISPAATSYYTTPADVVTRYNLVTNSIGASAFPAFAASWREQRIRTVHIYRISALAVSAALLPLCLVTAVLSSKLLSFWIDESFAVNSGTILKLLCVGVFLGGLDTISAGFLDAIGRPDASAKLSIGELALYVPLLYVLLLNFGVLGAASGWAVRMAMDYAIRSVICLRLYPELKGTLFQLIPAAIIGVIAVGVSLLPLAVSSAAIIAALLMLCFYGFIFFFCLTATERVAICLLPLRFWKILRKTFSTRKRPQT